MQNLTYSFLIIAGRSWLLNHGFFSSSRVLGILRAPSPRGPFRGGGGPLMHHCDLEAGYGGEMGSKLGWLPVDGASGDYPYSGIPPTAGLCTVLCDSSAASSSSS